MAGCLPEDLLVEFTEGRLSEASAAGVQQHLHRCLACLDLVVELGRSLEAAGTVPALSARAAAGPELPDEIDEYRLLRPLGRGAMGQVYLAHDTLLDRAVAIKVLAAGAAGPRHQERFLVEARAIARLQHPNVVSIYRVGQVAGKPYLVSELVRGQSLEGLPGPIPWERALRIGIGLARGLGAAHRRGVLHRDIKPANAILAADGEVKLLDFGLAKLLEPLAPLPAPGGEPGATSGSPPEPLGAGAEPADPDGAAPSLTRTGAVLGTPRYMAPEIWRGEVATRHADIYSLGALLYELCAGRAPYTGASLRDLYRAVQQGDAAPLFQVAPAVDPRLADIVDRCLRRNPAERYGSGDELCHALERCVGEGHGRAPALPSGNPYRGLYPFEVEHRALFFGRGPEIRAVVEHLRLEGIALVAGDSGVGKSSLCRAGVLPQIKDGALGEGRSWSIVTLVPGRHPLWVLAQALGRMMEGDGPGDAPEGAEGRDARHRRRLELQTEKAMHLLRTQPEEVARQIQLRQGEREGALLFLDQVEELVTQSDPGEAAVVTEALGRLGARLPGLRVLLTARADFLTSLAELPGLGEELTRALYLLRPMSAPALREAILGPAQGHGVRFESEALAQELAESSARAEGSLPLLQFALAELWEARDVEHQVIPAAALARIGGVEGALARHADGVLAGLLQGQQRAARRILLRLVTVEGVRVRRSGAELLGDDPGARVALEALVRGRLLVARESEGGVGYEIAHEALVQGWRTLRGWLDADTERRAARERLEGAAAEWERLQRAPDALWHEPRLRELKRVALSAADLPPREQSFLAASRRHARRRRVLSWGLRLGVPLVAGLLVLLGVEQRRSSEYRQRAEEIREKELGVQALYLLRRDGADRQALAAGVQAVAPAVRQGRVPPREAVEGLSAALAAARRAIVLQYGDKGVGTYGHFSPDGTRVLTFGNWSVEPFAALWDRRGGRPLATLPWGTNGAFAPDGTRILIWSRLWRPQGVVQLFDGQALAPLALLSGHTAPVRAATFSPDGARIATAGADRNVRLWDARDGRPLAVLTGHGAVVNTVSFSPDGKQVLTAADDGTARLFDGAGGRPLAVLPGHAPEAKAIFSPDGAHILTTDGESESPAVRLWDARTYRLLFALRGHTRRVNQAAFSPDGLRIATASDDQTVRLWDARTGVCAATLQGHRARVVSVAFSNDGRTLLSASGDSTARTWDAASGRPIEVLRAHAEELSGAEFAPDGRRALTLSLDQTARLWDLGEEFRLLGGHSDMVMYAEFAPDGGRALTAGWDRTVRVWDVNTGLPVVTIGAGNRIRLARFAPDGTRIVAFTYGPVQLWDSTSGRQVAEFKTELVGAGSFSPDGRRLLMLGPTRADPAPRVVDVRSGQALLRLEGEPFASSAFSPDGTRIITARDDIRIWDGGTGRLLRTIDAHGIWINMVQVSSDGQRVLSAGYDKTARVWDVRSGRLLLTLAGHLANVNTARFSPDGTRILTASDDQTVRLWDAHTGRLLGLYQEPGGGVNSADFAPDGQHILLSVPYEHMARIVPALPPPEVALRLGCEILRHQPEFAQVKGDCRGP